MAVESVNSRLFSKADRPLPELVMFAHVVSSASTRSDFLLSRPQIGESSHDVPNGQPDSGNQEPDDVANQTERAGSNIADLSKLLSTNSFFSERKERELTNHETRFRPWNTHDRCQRDGAGDPSCEAQQEPAEDKPEKISDCAHFLNVTLVRSHW
jgi:hypothetical protein